MKDDHIWYKKEKLNGKFEAKINAAKNIASNIDYEYFIIFVLFVMHLGINIMNLSLTTFGLTLFFTWFTLHMVEAFYSATFIRRINDNR